MRTGWLARGRTGGRRLEPRAALCALCLVSATSAYFPGCGETDRSAAGPPPRLRIAAASSVKRPLEEIAERFEAAHVGSDVILTFGASGTLYAQLANRAPFDLFLSADTSYPQRLVEENMTLEPGLHVYAVGTLVLWAPTEKGLRLATEGTGALSGDRVRKVAIANPRHAPYGRAAAEAIRALGLEETLRSRLVQGESAEQAAQFAQSGAADAAFIPLSLAVQPALREAGETWTVPAGTYTPIEHAFVTLSWVENAGAARDFASFLLGPEGREILVRHGLAPPEP